MLSRGVVYEDEVLCVAAHGKLTVAQWYGAPTEYHVWKIQDSLTERVRLYRGALLLVIVTQPFLPDERSRRRMTAVMDHFQSSLLAIDICIEVQGVVGSALRTISRAIALSSKARTPTSLSSTVEEAAGHLEEAVGSEVITASSICDVVSRARTRYSSRRPPAMVPM